MINYDNEKISDFLSIQPIPSLHHVKGWKEIAVSENGEELISLTKINHPQIVVESQYYLMQIEGSVNDCYVRKSVADKLVKATGLLPLNYRFIVWDTWRPVEVQQSLFNEYKDKFRDDKPHFTDEDLMEFTQTYVSLPSTDISKPSPHLTGGSIDLSILDDKGNLLNMGTEFDDFTIKASTRYFEEKLENNEYLKFEEKRALQNRRLLFHILSSVGFTNYCEEWWHFDYGNQFWAKVSQSESAIYGPIFL
jgi:D-alanyl-D-alanine dipeptidase